MQTVHIVLVFVEILRRAGVVAVEIGCADLLAEAVPVGMRQRQLHGEFLHRLLHVEGGAEADGAVVVIVPVHAAIHLLHALVVVHVHVEAVDGRLHGGHSVRHIAVMAVQHAVPGLEQRAAVLRDAEGLQVFRAEHEAVAGVEAQQAVVGVQHQRTAQEAEAAAHGLGERVPQGLVLLVAGHVRFQISHAHGVQHAAGQVDLRRALLAQRHILHLGGQQPGCGRAAQRAELLVVAE